MARGGARRLRLPVASFDAMSTALTCSRCGGPLGPEAAHRATTCAFCGATSSPLPEVVERIVERVIVATPKDAAGNLRCPRCADGLREVRASGAILRGCDRCGGIWLDKATVARLERARDDEIATAARRLVGVVMVRPDRSALASCPECGATMKRREIAGTIHLLDSCPEHGTWFDGFELPEFIRAFAEQRAGEITEEDAAAAGVPEDGFFTKLFRSFGG